MKKLFRVATLLTICLVVLGCFTACGMKGTAANSAIDPEGTKEQNIENNENIEEGRDDLEYSNKLQKVKDLMAQLEEVDENSGETIEALKTAYEDLDDKQKEQFEDFKDFVLTAQLQYEKASLYSKAMAAKDAGDFEEARKYFMTLFPRGPYKDATEQFEEMQASINGCNNDPDTNRLSGTAKVNKEKEILSAIKEGNFEFVTDKPSGVSWNIGIQEYPLFGYLHAYDTYCSFFNNLGGIDINKCGDVFKIETRGQGSPYTAEELTKMTAESYDAAKEIANKISANCSSDASEFQIAQETLNFFKDFYKKCSTRKSSGRKGLSQIESDNVYKILVEKQQGNNASAAFNILMEVQGIEAYGLMYTNRGNHSGASLVRLDGALFICDALEGSIYTLDDIPDTWNLIGEYSNINIIASIMGVNIENLSSLGKKNLIEASDGDLRIYVEYVSSDSNGNDTYLITAQNPNNASFSNYALKLGVGSQIVIKDSVSIQELKAGITVTIDSATKSMIDVEHEANAFFVQGIN